MEILGIDEAGRGCVIGPMVIAGIVAKNSVIEEFRNLGIKDSKKLTSKKRVKLAGKIKQQVLDFKIVLHQPEEIDLVSLNELDLQAIVGLINKFNPDRAVFDVPTHPNGVANFIQSVQLRIKTKTELVGENKADEKYPIVSAASILAKMRRDEIIEELKSEYGDFGSGYMSDSKTQQFLKKSYRRNKQLPVIVRKKWAPAKRLLYQQGNLLK